MAVHLASFLTDNCNYTSSNLNKTYDNTGYVCTYLTIFHHIVSKYGAFSTFFNNFVHFITDHRLDDDYSVASVKTKLICLQVQLHHLCHLHASYKTPYHAIGHSDVQSLPCTNHHCCEVSLLSNSPAGNPPFCRTLTFGQIIVIDLFLVTDEEYGHGDYCTILHWKVLPWRGV